MITSILREGSWVTPRRIRAYSVLSVLALVASIAYLLLTSHGVNDAQGRPLGTDFANIYAAGVLAAEGRAAEAYQPDRQYAQAQALFGADTTIYGWFYPPVMFLLAQPLATLPYGLALALALWLGVSAAAYLAVMRQLLPGRGVWLPALGFTAVWVNVTYGQSGFLLAALLGGALWLLPTRPFWAGVLMAGLSYKPQFAVLLPFVLLAAGQWRAIAGGAVAGAVLLLVTWLAYGWPVWEHFLTSLDISRQWVLAAGEAGFSKMQSPFAQIRLLGGSAAWAGYGQAAIALLVAACVMRHWRRHGAYADKATILLIGTALLSPYSFHYDVMLLAPAMAFAVQRAQTRGFLPYERSLMALLWILPMAAPSIAEAAHISPIPWLLLGWLGLLLRHARANAENMADRLG